MTNPNDINIACTILSQMGGARRIARMIGMKNTINHGDGVSFRFGKGRRGVNYVKITLNALDLYDVEFWKITRRGMNTTKVADFASVYADTLKPIFEEQTGLFLSFT